MNPLVYGLIMLGITIIFGLVCLIIGKRAIRRIKDLNSTIKAKEKVLQAQKETVNELDSQCKSIIESRNLAEQLLQNNYNKIKIVEQQLKDLNNNYKILDVQTQEKQQAINSLNELYKSQLKARKENIEEEAEIFKKQTYDNMLKEVEDCRISTEEKKKKIQEEYEAEKENFERILKEYKDKQDSIIKLNKEREELKENSKFYQLHITEDDLSDIKALNSIRHLLRNPEVLNKLIYKAYYEKPYTDLVGRVIGQKTITGIYKLTNTLNEKVYIGQAVDIKERWRQHLKRAVGAEPMTTNKLYPAMQEDGPYNFTWQVVEECTKDQLTEREKYWINYYEGQGYGYNIKG